MNCRESQYQVELCFFLLCPRRGAAQLHFQLCCSFSTENDRTLPHHALDCLTKDYFRERYSGYVRKI